MKDKNAVLMSQILKNEKNLEVAFETWRTFSGTQVFIEIREKFVSKLSDKILREIKLNFDLSEIDYHDESNSFKIKVYWILQKESWKNKIKFGIYDYDNDRLFFSIECLSDEKSERQIVHTAIKKILNEGTDYDNQWWSKVKEPYNRWESNFEGLRQFAFGNDIALDYFANRIISFIEAIDLHYSNINVDFK
jgi:hypothetical protein